MVTMLSHQLPTYSVSIIARRMKLVIYSLVIFALCAIVFGIHVTHAGGIPISVKTYTPWAGYAMPNGLWLEGDFSGDKKGDLVHVVNDTDYIHFWRSVGDGEFKVSTFRPWRGYAMPNGVWQTADLNGDGKLDIVHIVADTDYVHTWLSKGDGTFTVGTFRPWGGYAMPNGVWRVADINGDGKSDLIHIVRQKDYVHTWLSKGDGTFTVGTFRPWAGYAMPNGIWEVGDLNGDGKADLVHVVNNTDYVHTWLSRGNGNFTVGTFRPWAGYAMPNGVWKTGDLNGDGKTDLIHVVENKDYVHTWMSVGNGSFTVGTFRPWAGYAMPNGLWVTGDFNADGKTDLIHAVNNKDYVHTWLSKGNGTFTVGTFSPWRGYAIPNGLWPAIDITGDGKTDLVHIVNNTAYVHPWISTLPKPGEISVDGLEVTQTVQDMAHSVPLVANKQAVIRAYVSAETNHTISVRGKLTVRKLFPLGSSSTLTSVGNAELVHTEKDQLKPKREEIAKSLNFRLPSGFDNSGIILATLTEVTDASTGTPIACSNCAVTNRAAIFRNSSPLRVRVIGLRYTDGSPPQSYAPSTLDYQLIQSWLGRGYPTHQVLMSTRLVNASNTWPFGCGQANAQIAGIRNLDVNGGSVDARTHYYGLVADGGGFMRGCAAVPGTAQPSAIGSGPTGPGTFGWDTDGSYGDWYTAHELGHTFGRSHVGGTCGEAGTDSNYPFDDGQLSNSDSRFTGLDVGDPARSINMQALPGETWHDVMSYCQNQWVSSYTYDHIQQRLAAEQSVTSGAEMLAFGGDATMAPGMAISAGNLKGTQMVQPSLSSPPEVLEGISAPPPSVLGQDHPTRGATPSMAQPQAVQPSQSEPFQVPEPAMSGPPPIERGSPPPSASNQESFMRMDASPQGFEPVSYPEIKDGDFISIIALVNLTRNAGKFSSVNRMQRAIMRVQPPTDRARVRLIGSSGETLKDFPVEVMQDSDLETGEDVTGLIDAVIPFETGIARIELVLSGKVVDMRHVSKHAPEIRDLSVPSTARSFEGTGTALQPQTFAVSWDPSDEDGDTLTYTVQISRDQGQTWETMAVGLTERHYELDSDQLAELNNFMVRVIANDGFNSAIVTSESVNNSN
jgi:VCBS repeat protein